MWERRAAISGFPGSRPSGQLAAIMESHFAYEEREIGAALDGGIPDTGWSGMVFRFRDGNRGVEELEEASE